MYYCLYYWLIAPHRGKVKDNPSRKPAFSIDLKTPDGEAYDLGLYCDQHGDPECARLRIPHLEGEAIRESLLPLLQTVKEHLLSVLRLTFRPDTMLAEPSTFWSFLKEGKPHDIRMSVRWHGGSTYDPQKTRDLFIHSFNIRDLFRLYVDGVDERIPLQYRFLSLYKVLENRFLVGGQWQHNALSKFL